MRFRGSRLRVPQLAGCQVPRATNELMLFALFSAFGSLVEKYRYITILIVLTRCIDITMHIIFIIRQAWCEVQGETLVNYANGVNVGSTKI